MKTIFNTDNDDDDEDYHDDDDNNINDNDIHDDIIHDEQYLSASVILFVIIMKNKVICICI